MSRRRANVLAALVAASAAAVLGFWALRTPTAALRPPPSARVPTAEMPARPEPALPAAPRPTAAAAVAASAPLSAAPSAARDAILLDEPELMTTLRELRGSDPNLTLRLAREGNERFQRGPDAAERTWFIVKSLSDLGRHDEARVEGRELLARYAGTRWAEDVHRHLFVNPPTHPFERGYGKTLESD